MRRLKMIFRKYFIADMTERFVLVVLGLYLAYFACDVLSISYAMFMFNYFSTLFSAKLLSITMQEIKNNSDCALMCLYAFITFTFGYIVILATL